MSLSVCPAVFFDFAYACMCINEHLHVWRSMCVLVCMNAWVPVYVEATH